MKGLGEGKRIIVWNHKLLEGTLGTIPFIPFTLHIKILKPGKAKVHFHGDGLVGAVQA